MGSAGSLMHQLSPVDHLSPRVHVPKLLYFASEEEPDAIVRTLRDGLAKSISALPILGGTVGLLPGAAQKGTLAIQAPFFEADDSNQPSSLFSLLDIAALEFSALDHCNKHHANMR